GGNRGFESRWGHSFSPLTGLSVKVPTDQDGSRETENGHEMVTARRRSVTLLETGDHGGDAPAPVGAELPLGHALPRLGGEGAPRVRWAGVAQGTAAGRLRSRR